MDLISSLFSSTLGKIAPIILILLLLSLAANYLQESRNNALKVENKLIKERMGDVIAENQSLSVLVEKREQERDANQGLIDDLSKKTHALNQQALNTQAQVRTVIQHEECSYTAIPSAAVERMRQQYSGSDPIQNDRAKTTSGVD